MKKNSGKFTIYKKFGSFDACVLPPEVDEKGYIRKEGAILIEAAPIPSGEEGKRDWSKKIFFALGIADIAILMDNMDHPKKLIHDMNGQIKSLEFVPATDEKYAGTYMMKLLTKDGEGNPLSVSLPLSRGEFQLFIRMMIQMAPYLIGWLE